MKTWVAIAIFALLIFGLEALQKDLTEVYKCGHQTPKTCSSKNAGDRKVCKDGYECCTCAPCKRSDMCTKAKKCDRPVPETCFMNTPVVPPTDVATPKCYIGGCSSEICSAKNGVISTCDVKPSDACKEHTTCEYHKGECQWVPNKAYLSCMATAGDPCTGPPTYGHCKMRIKGFMFDRASKTCKKFDGGGCGLTNNGFTKQEECESRCGIRKEGELCGPACGGMKSYGPCDEGLFCHKVTKDCFNGVCRKNETDLSDLECGMEMGCSSNDPKNRQICKTGEVCCSCCSKEKVWGAKVCCKRPDSCAKKCPTNEYEVPEKCYMSTTSVAPKFCDKKCPEGQYPKGSNTDPLCTEVPIEGDECCVAVSCIGVPPMCKDEIPSGCLNGTSPDMVPLEVHHDSCKGFIELGKALGISKECVCDIEWKNIQGHHISTDLMTCDMMTPGMVKDNCKATCDSCMIPTTTPKPVCKDIWKPKQCKKQATKQKCKKSKNVKKNCMKSCKICKA